MPYRTIKPAEAKALLEGKDGWTYVDVRSVEEFDAGHPAGAWNVPLAVRDPSGRMAPNPDFASVMERAFAKDARLVVGCAAGGRSRTACEMLQAAGFTSLANMHGGFSGAHDAFGGASEPGWQACGFPTETSPRAGRAYAALRAKG